MVFKGEVGDHVGRLKMKWREKTYNSVELRSLVTLWSTERVLMFAGAELAEVFSRSGHYIGEELECYAAEWFA